MRTSALKYGLLTWVSSLTILIILLMPFHAFLTVWLSSLVGHYTALRLWKEVLLLIAAIAALFLLATDHKIRSHTISRRLFWLIVAFGLVTIGSGLMALASHRVSDKALGYGLIIDLRFLLFFLITWAVSLRLMRMRTHWQWITLWPAAVVVGFGLLQILVLPHDFLAHFGYNSSTIFPYATINHDSHYIRIASTLRGANPLGAYLIIPISFLAVLLLKRVIQKRQIVLLLGAAVCLFFSFSRSAWLGAALAFAIALILSVHSRRGRKLMAGGLTAVAIVLVGIFVGLQHNHRFQNFVFHTQDQSQVKVSSNDDHEKALKSGLHDIAKHPLGSGTGTAGPASVYNSGHEPRIAENFYLQIGQESGLLGLVLFLLINAGTGYLLWLRRSDPLALALFASFIGLSFVNLLSHAWADDTLAYVWWGLAGIAMAPNLKAERDEARAKQRHEPKTGPSRPKSSHHVD